MIRYDQNNQEYLLKLKPNKLFDIPVIIFILLFIFFFFSLIYKVTIYQNSKLLIKQTDSSYHYYLYTNLDNLKNVATSKKITLNDSNYPYTIKGISDIMYDDVLKINYQLVEIKINLPKKYQFNNLALDVKIILKEEKLLTKIKRILLEGE